MRLHASRLATIRCASLCLAGADALGVVIFNFAFCVTVPSWLNEKAPSCSVNRVFWTATTTATALYATVGILGALAFPNAPENMLSLLMLSSHVGLTTRLCATLFGVLIIGLGIPIFCVIMRYNLVSGGEHTLRVEITLEIALELALEITLEITLESTLEITLEITLEMMLETTLDSRRDPIKPAPRSRRELTHLCGWRYVGLCSEAWAHVWSSVLPWATAWTLYQGNALLQLVSLSGLLLNGFIDFLMPGLVTLVSLGALSRLRHCIRHCALRVCRDGADIASSSLPPPPLQVMSTPIRPLPACLQPYYLPLVAGMVAFLLVLLPAAVWLQLYCADSKVCYPMDQSTKS